MSRLFDRLRWVVIVFALLAVLLAVGIKSTMCVTRLHVAHLLADFQSIQPLHSNWADAERLMHHWGRWGHYEGSCTAVDCSYTIDVEDGLSQLFGQLSENAAGFMLNHGLHSALGKIGWHAITFSMNFTVRDSIIVHTHTRLTLEVSPHFVASDWNQGYALIFQTQVYPRLTVPAATSGSAERRGYLRMLGPAGTPSDHPDYKVGRPDGCTICMAGELTYTPTLPHDEIVRLTSYNLSCITGWRQCRSLEDLLPAASEWHLYTGWDDPNYRYPPDPPPIPCTAAPRALGRDADVAFEADVLSARTDQHQEFDNWPFYMREIDTIRIRRILKGSPPFAVHQQIEIAPYSISAYRSGIRHTTEHLHPGTQAILFFQGASSDQAIFETPPCGIVDDTPSTLSAVLLGISQDVLTRHSDAYQ